MTAALFAGLIAAVSTRSLRAAESAPGAPVVKLPEFVVKAELPWTYVEVAGFEVISMASDEATNRFVRGLRHQVALFETLLPEDFRQPPSAHALVILHVYDAPPEVYQRLDSRDSAAPVQHWTGIARDGYFGATLSDPADYDMPTYTVNVVWFESNDYAGRRMRLETAVRHLLWKLDCRKPKPPAWLGAGLRAALTGAPVTDSGFRLVELSVIDASRPLDLKPVLEGGAVANPAFPSMGGPPDSNTLAAAKFVMWGLLNKEYSARFWNFVRRASEENVDEALFKECFGFAYGAANRRVGGFFPKANELVNITLPEQSIPKFPDTLVLRPARPSELGRIIGEWRRQAAFLETDPGRFKAATEGARISVEKTLPKSPDSRLLAALGICEAQAGEMDNAVEHLGAAVHARVIRPRAYLEFARLLFQREIRGLKDPSAMLSEKQTLAVLEPLRAGAEQSPALNGTYRLAIQVWAHSAAQPKEADLDFIEQGTRLFPKDSQLAVAAIQVHAKHGMKARAASIANRWLKTVDEKTRMQFEQGGFSGESNR